MKTTNTSHHSSYAHQAFLSFLCSTSTSFVSSVCLSVSAPCRQSLSLSSVSLLGLHCCTLFGLLYLCVSACVFLEVKKKAQGRVVVEGVRNFAQCDSAALHHSFTSSSSPAPSCLRLNSTMKYGILSFRPKFSQTITSNFASAGSSRTFPSKKTFFSL